MISLKKYLDSSGAAAMPSLPGDTAVLPAVIAAYGSALVAMGSSSLDACPALGDDLKRKLDRIREELSEQTPAPAIRATDTEVQQSLQAWGMQTASHYRQKTGEVRELLLLMARTAESVGERDQRCAGQINQVTARLKTIASLEDLSEIRSSIEASAADLKTSIDRMAAEGKAALSELRAEVTVYQAKLEEAEEAASRDGLTRLRNRACVEGQIERRIAEAALFCVAILDIDEFKSVNDQHGHLAGDELLRQFAAELKSACRSTDVIGRWGGDEFIVLLNCGWAEAEAQIERLKKWVCGNYSLETKAGPRKLNIRASIGLAEHKRGQDLKALLATADAEMYKCKRPSHTR